MKKKKRGTCKKGKKNYADGLSLQEIVYELISKQEKVMQVLAIIALVAGVGYGVEHDWKVAKAYKSHKECRAENPKFHNTMTQWKYDPCNLVAYVKHNSK